MTWDTPRTFTDGTQFNRRNTMNTNHINVTNDDAIIEAALKILKFRIPYNSDSPSLTSPQDSKDYVKLKLATYEYEVFACLFLDQRHRVIRFEEMFKGTIDGANVYPREIVKATLKHNAAAVIFAHNHPSGNAEPSQSDERITQRLKDALALIDVRVLDHLVVGEDVISFAERGLL